MATPNKPFVGLALLYPTEATRSLTQSDFGAVSNTLTALQPLVTDEALRQALDHFVQEVGKQDVQRARQILEQSVLPLVENLSPDLWQRYMREAGWLRRSASRFEKSERVIKRARALIAGNEQGKEWTQFSEIEKWYREIQRIKDFTGIESLGRLPETIQFERHREGSIRTNLDKTAFSLRAKTLQGMTPIEALKLILQAKSYFDRYSEIKRAGQRDLLIKEVQAINSYSAPWTNAWAWVELFWQYEQFLKSQPSAHSGVHLEGDVPVLREIAQAYKVVTVLEVDGKKRARDNETWFVNSAVTKKGNQTQKSAERMIVLKKDRAVLIHFDGAPNYDDTSWKRLVRLILFSDATLTWVKTHGQWDSSHPELVAIEGQRSWYGLNAQYQKASMLERQKYTEALGFIRNLVFQFSPHVTVPPPKPNSTKDEIQKLKRKMLLTFHPDRISGGGLNIGDQYVKLIEAFEILETFHP